MIGRSVKNVWRQPLIFLPLFLCSALCVFLILLCASVYASCCEMEAEIADTTAITLTVSCKERMERVYKKDGKYTEIINANPSLLDENVLNLLTQTDTVTQLRYYTNSFRMDISWLCSLPIYEEILRTVHVGEELVFPPQFYSCGEENYTYVNIAGFSSEAEISGMLGGDEDSLVLHRTGDGGIWIPECMYELYGQPKELVFGWYDCRLYNGSQLNSPETIQHELAKVDPSAEAVICPVAGWYESANAPHTDVLCDMETWRTLYNVAVNYHRWEVIENPYREGNPTDLLGMAFLQAEIDSPRNTESTIRTWIDNGITTENYLITADDYDFKFAMAQIAGVKMFAGIALAVAVFLGAFIPLICVSYSTHRRGGEIYTLRSIGMGRGKIIATMFAESAAVLAIAFFIGWGVGAFCGGEICTAVQENIVADACEAEMRLSRKIDYMADGDAIREQLQNAMEKFSRVDVSVQYAPPTGIYGVLILLLLIVLLWTAGVLTVRTRDNLMKKERDV